MKTWRCFHCDEVFRDEEAARLHFGDSLMHAAACKVDVAALRELERQLACYREEDTDLHREIHRLHAEHLVALRRAEEDGYAKGLRDGRHKIPL